MPDQNTTEPTAPARGPLADVADHLDNELQRIVDAKDHAKSTLPGSGSPAEAAMAQIDKLSNIAGRIMSKISPMIRDWGIAGQINPNDQMENLALIAEQQEKIKYLEEVSVSKTGRINELESSNTVKDTKISDQIARIDELKTEITKIDEAASALDRKLEAAEADKARMAVEIHRLQGNGSIPQQSTVDGSNPSSVRETAATGVEQQIEHDRSQDTMIGSGSVQQIKQAIATATNPRQSENHEVQADKNEPDDDHPA